MTAVNYLTKTELPDAFNKGNLDQASQQAIIDQLINDGLYTNSNHDGKSVWVESDIYKNHVQPPLFDAGGNPAFDAGRGIPSCCPAAVLRGAMTFTISTTAPAIRPLISAPGTIRSTSLRPTGMTRSLMAAPGPIL